MNVSIIYVNYHTRKLIEDSISSIVKYCKCDDFEIIIVDNHTDEGLGDYLCRIFPELTIIYLYLDKNIGFGRANNEGLKIAKGRNVLFLNPDTLLMNDAIIRLISYLDEHENVGAVGGNLFDENGKPAESYRVWVPSISYAINVLFGYLPLKIKYGRNTHFNHSEKPLDVPYVCGADLMIRKSVLDIIGGFDPDFFMYFEETDLCLRIRKLGYKIKCIPDAHIMHLEGRSFGEQDKEKVARRETLYNESKRLFIEKNYSSAYIRLLNILQLLAKPIEKIKNKLMK